MKKLSAFCISGTHSGCGKTTITLGIISALKKKGLRVQPFKIGPDFIDPGHHRRVAERDSHNLDSWMMNSDYNKGIFLRYSMDADVSIVEGVMGLYDGFSPTEQIGSSAEMAKILGIPVVLVVDASSMARSVSALVKGFKEYDPDLDIKGVILNRVGSASHAELLKEAIYHDLPGLKILGVLKKENDIMMESRHLGLITDEDAPLDPYRIEILANWIEQGLELDLLLNEMKIEIDEEIHFLKASSQDSYKEPVRLGIAMDKAFCFYYPENLRLLKESGTELVPFSPLRDKELPSNIQGIILGGGYPELYARELSENQSIREEIRDFSLKGGPIYAECGGFMYLTDKIRDMDGNEYEMVGVFPLRSVMSSSLKKLGYREVITNIDTLLGPAGTRIRGHEFHYSFLEGDIGALDKAYKVFTRKDSSFMLDGLIRGNTIASYIHLHWGSNPSISDNFVKFCKRCRSYHEKQKKSRGSIRYRKAII